mgnify:FL=1
MLLQVILLTLGCNGAIVADGEYGEMTAVGVRELQKRLGFAEAECDGNFGPVTREAFRLTYSLEVNALKADLFVGETVVV